MPDRDTDLNPTDPPDNQGGGNVKTTSTEEAANLSDAAPIDPPDNQGGGEG